MRITNLRPNPLQINEKTSGADIEADFWRELKAIKITTNLELSDLETESIGWTKLAPGSHLHTANEQSGLIDIVGIATSSMVADNVLWLF
jgi:hypothetical protein